MAVSDHLAAPSDLGTVRADEEFWDLVCADDDWLRAEFDAIIAAGFPERVRPPCRAQRPGHGPRSRRRRRAHRAGSPPEPGADRQSLPRERSPPARR